MPSQPAFFTGALRGRVPPEPAWTLVDGTALRLRAVHAEDAAALGVLLGGLDAGARRQRVHGAVNVGSPSFLARMTQVDARHEWAVVVEVDRADGSSVLVAEARLAWGAGGEVAEFGLSVAGQWQRQGIARRTLGALMDEARRRGLRALRGHVVAGNVPMQALLVGMGFGARADEDGPCFQAALQPAAAQRPGNPALPGRHPARAPGLLAGLRRLWADLAAA
jgi:acetyltransferase